MKTRATIKNITKVRRALNGYQNRLMGGINNTINELCNIGVKVGQTNFDSFTEYAGENNVRVSYLFDKSETTPHAIVLATGTNITCIEFGTGQYFEPNDWSVEQGFSRGGFGQGKGNNEGWGYYDNGRNQGNAVPIRISKDGKQVFFTRGNYPARAMFGACEEMIRNYKQIVDRQVKWSPRGRNQ